ncbi:MAG: YciI family protein [Kofleriaceae bacterium]|nr:YciI family protein [Kofleriaceae bacterium]
MFTTASVRHLSLILATAATIGVAGCAPDVTAAPKRGAEYTILIYESPAALASRTDAKLSDAYWTSYDQFAAQLATANVLRGGSALSETDSRVVKGKGGADQAVAGARLGGYFVIEAADLEAATAWAKKAPPDAIAVEVRPHRANPHAAQMMMKMK